MSQIGKTYKSAFAFAVVAGISLFASGSAHAQEKKGVITLSEVKIVGRVQKPIASVDVNRIAVNLTLAELRQPFLDRIEEATHTDPF